jgi:hypothetical protein
LFENCGLLVILFWAMLLPERTAAAAAVLPTSTSPMSRSRTSW